MKNSSKNTYILVAESYDKGNKTALSICKDTGIPQRTAGRYLEKYKLKIPVEDIKEKGRPLIVKSEDTAAITEYVRQNKFITSNKVSKMLYKKRGISVTPKTIRNHLHKSGHINSLPKTIPVITDASKTKRVDFALKNKSTSWNNVFFSDETSIQMGPNNICAWYKKGHRPNKIKTKYPQKVMFWSAVSTQYKFELVEIKGTMTSKKYIDLLQSSFLPWIKKQKKGNIIFQQDNAPCHTAKKTREFFAQEKLSCLDWPPYSPDLNPIENLWGILKYNVNLRNPTTLEELISFSKEEWLKISMKTVRKCINNMQERLNKVIQSKGEKIDY